MLTIGSNFSGPNPLLRVYKSHTYEWYSGATEKRNVVQNQKNKIPILQAMVWARQAIGYLVSFDFLVIVRNSVDCGPSCILLCGKVFECRKIGLIRCRFSYSLILRELTFFVLMVFWVEWKHKTYTGVWIPIIG